MIFEGMPNLVKLLHFLWLFFILLYFVGKRLLKRLKEIESDPRKA